MDSNKVTAKVKWWNEEKSYGFLVAPGINRDIFVHRSQLNKSGIESLYEDQEVKCFVKDGQKGMYAQNIELVPSRVK
jgi:CspA family cold shock protein